MIERAELPHPGYSWLITRDDESGKFRWVAYKPAPYKEPTERLSGLEETWKAAMRAADEALANF